MIGSKILIEFAYAAIYHIVKWTTESAYAAIYHIK